MRYVDFEALKKEELLNNRKTGDAILYNSIRYGVKKRTAGLPYHEALEIERKFLQKELKRRSKMILKDRQWAEIWGVSIYLKYEEGYYPRGLPRFIDYESCILEGLTQCEWMIRKGWECRICRGSDPHVILDRFNPYLAGEKYVIDTIDIDSRSEREYSFVHVNFIGGISKKMLFEDFINWTRSIDRYGEIPKIQVESAPWIK